MLGYIHANLQLKKIHINPQTVDFKLEHVWALIYQRHKRPTDLIHNRILGIAGAVHQQAFESVHDAREGWMKCLINVYAKLKMCVCQINTQQEISQSSPLDRNASLLEQPIGARRCSRNARARRASFDCMQKNSIYKNILICSQSFRTFFFNNNDSTGSKWRHFHLFSKNSTKKTVLN